MFTRSKPASMWALLGSFFFTWVSLQIFGYCIGFFAKQEYISMYYVHLFFTIYQLYATQWLFLSSKSTIKNLLTMYKMLVCVVISIACLSGRPPLWINVFFLKEISFVSDLIHIRQITRILGEQLPNMKDANHVNKRNRVLKMFRYIPTIITVYLSWHHGLWSMFFLITSHLLIDIVYRK